MEADPKRVPSSPRRGGTAVFLQNRDFFGAMVVHVPLLHALRRAEPEAPLVVYSPFERGRMFATIGLADDVRVYAAPNGALWSELRERRFVRVVSLRPQSFGLTALLTTVGAGRTLGYATPLSRLAFTRTVPRDVTIYRATNYLNLLAGECPIPSLHDAVVALAALDGAPRADAERAAGAPYVLMPCGSEERKLWGEANFVALARALAASEPDARFVLVLGGGERRYVEWFERAGLSSRTTSLVDASLPRIARAVLGARAVVANDCGPSHVAQLADVPSVFVFGNWDGVARARIDEWFHPKPGARCLTTDRAAPVANLAVSDVLEAVREVRDDPRTPSRIVEVAPTTGASADA